LASGLELVAFPLVDLVVLPPVLAMFVGSGHKKTRWPRGVKDSELKITQKIEKTKSTDDKAELILVKPLNLSNQVEFSRPKTNTNVI